MLRRLFCNPNNTTNIYCKNHKFLCVRHNSTIGFVGLGNMGFYMAKNLTNKSFNVKAYDINQESIDKFKSCGGSGTNDLKELAQNSSIIILMLPATKHVAHTLQNEINGIFKFANKNTLIIDSSTIDPMASKELQSEAKRYGMRMIDAPVSGGTTGAAHGTLTFMVGGSESDLNDAKASQPVLNAMGKNIVHCGDGGAG
eukprot:gene11111-14913_t